MKTKQLLIIAILLSTFSLFSQENNQKYAQAKIFYSNTTDLEILLQNGVAVDHGKNKVLNYIESVFSTYEINKAKSLGYQVEILIEDMQKHIENRKKEVFQKNEAPCDIASNNVYQTPTNFNLGSMGGFLTLDEMLQELDDMKTLYPNLITTKSPISTFSTFEGRSIYWVKISDNPTVNEEEPEMLFTAIHHAREPASMQQLIFYMWYLLENYDSDDEIKAIVDNTEQFFVPILNVDGYRYNQTTNPNGGGFWRKNRRDNGDGSFGVDNNRNYSWHWGEAGVSDSFGQTYPGIAAFSEVENQAIKWFTEQHEFVMALNNHSYSELLLYPFGWAENVPTPEDDLFQAISGLMVSQNGYDNIISSDLYPAAGVSDDWMYGDTTTKNKIYAMTPEIGSSFWPSESQIIPICKEMMFNNITAAHLITNYADLRETNDLFMSSLTGDINYSIKRLGTQTPADFTVSIIPISTNIVSVGNPNTHNNMNLLQEDNDVISYELSNAIQDGDEISYNLVLDNGQFVTEKIIEKIYGNPTSVFTDNGNNLDNYDSTQWNTTTESYFSASSSITDSPFSSYNNNENKTIELSNSIDLSDNLYAQVSFYTKWDIEAGYDYVQFEISIDNGVTWIPQCGKYTKSGTQNQFIVDQPMYDGTQTEWVKEEISLSDYFEQEIKFRFQLVSDGNLVEDGFYFDDFKIETIANNPASVENNVFNNIVVYPNPTTNRLTIRIPNLVQETIVTVFSINGQLLKTINTANQEIKLDLTSYATGLYFVNLKNKSATKTIKIIKR